MDIVIAGRDGTPLRQTGDFSLDLAYGDDENSFTLSGLTGPRLEPGARWWMDGTPWGGIVDTVTMDGPEVGYKGRDVHGLMACKVVRPDSGQSHLTVTGEANSVISQLLERCSLTGWLRASAGDSGFTVDGYRFHRYIDLWTGLRMMLSSCGARAEMRFVDGSPVVSAVPRDTYGDIPSELVDFKAERTYRPVNHLIGLGTGEGAERQVVDWYAGEDGTVGKEQSLFGVDEVAEVYDLSSESDDLDGKTREKLEEYQGQGTAETSIPDDSGLDVGDVARASNAEVGIGVSAEVVKVIVKVDSGSPSVSYETGTPEWPEGEA